MERNYASIAVALLGAAKLILESYGIHIIDNGQIDAIANGVSAVVAVVGVVATHLKRPVDPAPVEPTKQ